MLRITIGFIAGVYVSQEYKKDIPDITLIINGIKSDILKKYNEYTRKNN
jgi:hypothetical protein